MEKVYYYCTKCAEGYPEGSVHPEHCGSGDRVPLNGITVIEDFITEEEEKLLHSMINQSPWTMSQSGRRKQVSVI